MNAPKRIADVLDELAAKALAAEPEDSDAIIHIGASLEEIVENDDNAACLGEVGDALECVLDASHAIYSRTVQEPTEALTAIVAVMAAASQHLNGAQHGTNFSRPLARLQALLQQPVAAEDDTPETETEGVDLDHSPETDMPAPADATDTAVLDRHADTALVQEFADESREHLAEAEAALLTLEGNPENTEALNTIFRAFHTIKGVAGFIPGLDHIQVLSHHAESLLEMARGGRLRMVGEYADLALGACDCLAALLDELEDSEPGDALGSGPTYHKLLERLSAVDTTEQATMPVDDPNCANDTRNIPHTEDPAASTRDHDGQEEQLTGPAADTPGTTLESQPRPDKAGTVRVDTARLDRLVDALGELVVAQSMVAQENIVRQDDQSSLARNVAHTGKIIRELQDISMSLRMIPLHGTFAKLTRLVRDVARKAGKQVRLVCEGADTEIDRNMVELIKDPLVHMIRNAVDHGIEKPEQRDAAGKAPQGTVRVRAYHSAGNVVIEVTDDGKGLDRDRIVETAKKRGIIKSSKSMRDTDVYSLIFHPGFSTADKVTDISGRGVGMDVVKMAIEQLRGRVDVTSAKGRGSTFTIHVPLTMAITDAMLLRVGSQRYLLPIVSIERSMLPEADKLYSVSGRGQMIKLHGQLLPVYRLHELFEVDGAKTDPLDSVMVVVEGEGRRYALMVDELLGQRQVVVKSLGHALRRIRGIAGAAILGDGRLGLILDPVGLTQIQAGTGAKEGLRKVS
jgi:two-component system chemotaxis sensor kinase CheA